MNRIVAEDVAAVVADPVIAAAAAAFRGLTVVIAGGGGLIARSTAFALAELSAVHGLGLSIVALVRDPEKARRGYAIHPRGASITLVAQTLGKPLEYDGPADVIVHAGGGSSPHAYQHDPYGVAAANARAGFDLVDLARKRDTRRIAYFSSREVYGNATPVAQRPAGSSSPAGSGHPGPSSGGTAPGNGGPESPGPAAPLGEETIGSFDHLAVRNSYPEAKRMTEATLAVAAWQFGLGFQALRLASVYGPGMLLVDDGRAMADLIGARLAGRDLVLASDGSTIRGYCYVADAVRGILIALLAGAENTVYNIANETEPISILGLAELLATLPGGGPSPSVITGPATTPAGYSSFGYLPASTARLEALGWRPRVTLREGLVRTLEFFGDQN